MNGLAGCARRMGQVLVGRPLPALEAQNREGQAVVTVINAITAKSSDVGAALREAYKRIAEEPVPARIMGVLAELGIEGNDHGGGKSGQPD